MEATGGQTQLLGQPEPIALGERSRHLKLRVGDPSASMLEVDGRRVALGMLRELRCIERVNSLAGRGVRIGARCGR